MGVRTHRDMLEEATHLFYKAPKLSRQCPILRQVYRQPYFLSQPPLESLPKIVRKAHLVRKPHVYLN